MKITLPAALAHHLPQETVAMVERIMRENLTSVARPWDDGSVFVITGDIPAMWLRDSAAQLRPYLLICADDPALQDVLIGVLRRQIRFLRGDPYANSFRDSGTASWHATDVSEAGPHTWERKFELDSLCFPIELAHRLWRLTGRADFLDAEFAAALGTVLDVMTTEQDHEGRSRYTFTRPRASITDTLVRGGRGRRTTPCGLVWSGFRPSDDACDLGYNIPGNMFAVTALGYLEEIAREHYGDPERAARAADLRASVDDAIRRHGIVDGGYAYEVDGAGNYLLMDDANMPSLLSAPLSGYLRADDPVYLETRRLLLSERNPYYYRGTQAAGIGSPHTPCGYVWPIALAVAGLTSLDPAEKRANLELLTATTGGTGRMHESFDPSRPEEYTRPWFSWADAMFCELALDIAGIGFDTLTPVAGVGVPRG